MQGYLGKLILLTVTVTDFKLTVQSWNWIKQVLSLNSSIWFEDPQEHPGCSTPLLHVTVWRPDAFPHFCPRSWKTTQTFYRWSFAWFCPHIALSLHAAFFFPAEPWVSLEVMRWRPSAPCFFRTLNFHPRCIISCYYMNIDQASDVNIVCCFIFFSRSA